MTRKLRVFLPLLLGLGSVLFIVSAFTMANVVIDKFQVIDNYGHEAARVMNINSSDYGPKTIHCLANVLGEKKEIITGSDWENISYEYADSISNEFILGELKWAIKVPNYLLDPFIKKGVKAFLDSATTQGKKNAIKSLNHYLLRLSYVSNLPDAKKRQFFNDLKDWSPNAQVYFLQYLALCDQLTVTDTATMDRFDKEYFLKRVNQDALNGYKRFLATMKGRGFGWNPAERINGYPGISVTKFDNNHDLWVASIRWATYLKDPNAFTKYDSHIYDKASYHGWVKVLEKMKYSIGVILVYLK